MEEKSAQKRLLRDFAPRIQVGARLKQSRDGGGADLASQKARRRSFLRASRFRMTWLSRKAVRAARPWRFANRCSGITLRRLVFPDLLRCVRNLPAASAELWTLVMGTQPLRCSLQDSAPMKCSNQADAD